MYKKNYTPCPNDFFPKVIRQVQYLKINIIYHIKNPKKNNPLIILIAAQTTFDIIQYLFNNKNSQRSGSRGEHL